MEQNTSKDTSCTWAKHIDPPVMIDFKVSDHRIWILVLLLQKLHVGECLSWIEANASKFWVKLCNDHVHSWDKEGLDDLIVIESGSRWFDRVVDQAHERRCKCDSTDSCPDTSEVCVIITVCVAWWSLGCEVSKPSIWHSCIKIIQVFLSSVLILHVRLIDQSHPSKDCANASTSELR